MSTLPRPSAINFSVVFPCLNEAETVGQCIDAVKTVMDTQSLVYEIIVADNGSTDASVLIADTHGARVVHIPERGYGNALLGGLRAANGTYILMMDCDGSYSADDIPAFLHVCRSGADFVTGNRFAAGGGRILPGAMPLLHQYIGNPFFAWLFRVFFHVPIHDAFCGMRAIHQSLLRSLRLKQPGMEFALELLLEAHAKGTKCRETPITLHPDCRHLHGSHLRIVRDGWRGLTFLMRYKCKRARRPRLNADEIAVAKYYPDQLSDRPRLCSDL